MTREEKSVYLIDNFDSFVHNLARYFRQLGQPTIVVRNDAADVEALIRAKPAAIVISPGPCTPNEAGCSLDVVNRLAGQCPILGVCLGHQVIGQAFGGQVVRAEPMHGVASVVRHTGEDLFAQLPNPLRVGRYHSLVVDPGSLPERLAVQAQTDDGLVMAIRDRLTPTWGVQFHPESLLTEGGYLLLANFLRLAGLSIPVDVASLSP